MNYYKRHLGDYASAAGHLSALEHGIYNLLIDWYYANEQAIPDGTAHRIARSPRQDVQVVLEEFFQRDGDVWKHKRIEREIADYLVKAEENRRVGRLGGRPKKTQTVSEITQTVSENNQVGSENNPTVTLANSHKPLANTKNKSNGDGYAADFVLFWESYPRKDNKAAAAKAWRKLSTESREQAAADVSARVWGDATFIPHAATYLNNRRWEDDTAPQPSRHWAASGLVI